MASRARGKENPRKRYAAGPVPDPRYLVRGSSRRILSVQRAKTRPAYISMTNRRALPLDAILMGFKEYAGGQRTM